MTLSMEPTPHEAAPAIAPDRPGGAETDEAIVARVRAGERDLYAVLMRRHNPRVYRVARSIVRDEAEAEDVMQEAYVRAFEHLHAFEGRSRFSTWLTRIAVHEALGRVRKRRRFASLEDDVDEASMTTSETTSPERQTSDGEVRRLLEDAVDRLPEEFRTTFVLRMVEGLTSGEAADCLGVPEETVRTRLFRARNRLQEILAEAFEPVAPRVYEFHLSRCDRVVDAVMNRIGTLAERRP